MHLKAIIQEHNRLNGLRFSVSEFALVTVAALFIAFGGYRNNLGWAMVGGIGITINSLTVCLIGIRQILAREPSGSILDFRRSSHRERVGHSVPNLGRHTLVICLFTIIPFVLAIIVAVRGMLRSSD